MCTVADLKLSVMTMDLTAHDKRRVIGKMCLFEADWSEDDADSSDENSVDEVNRPAARDAADGMSSGAESECLL